MMEMFNTIRLITGGLDAHGVKYIFREEEQYQEVQVPFGIKNGPFVNVRFISHNHGNDTAVRIMNLVNKVPDEKHFRMLEVCKTLNSKFRFVKFNMDQDNDLHVEYDFPQSTGSECLGEMSFEIFIRILQILNEGFPFIAKALYVPEEEALPLREDPEGEKDLLNLLEKNHDEINIRISKGTPADENPGEP